MAVEGTQVALAVMKAERRVKLEPFARAVQAPGTGAILCGELLAPLMRPSVQVVRPSGAVESVRLVRQAGRSFCAGLELPTVGVHTVVVSAGKDAALTVAGVFQVRVGPY